MIGQEAKNDQDAFALGPPFRKEPRTRTSPVRVLSKGDGGDVKQSNEASSNAEAART